MANAKIQKKKMSKNSLIALVVTIAILIGLVVSLLTGTGFLVRVSKGASSEHFKVNGAMMSYFANSYYQNWLSNYYYYIMFGLISFDPSAPLDEQKTTDGKTTYYDYFVNGTKSTVETYLVYCEAAMVDPDVDYDALENDAKQYAKDTIKALKAQAKASNMGTQAYIRQQLEAFGGYLSVRDLRKALEIEYIASTYYQTVYNRTHDSIDEAREDEFFKANLETFIKAEYILLTINSTIVAETVDEKAYPLGKEDPDYKAAVEAAEEKAKKENGFAKIADKEIIDKLGTAKTLDEFKTMLLDYKYDEVFKSTYEAAVKNFVTADKPSEEALNAYKAELKDKVIAAVIAGKDDLTTEEVAPTAEGDSTTTEKTKWETAQETFPKTLITNLKKVITDNTKTVSYTLSTDLGKFLFGGVKAQYGIDYAEGEDKNGTSAGKYTNFFEDKEMTEEEQKTGKYSLSLYFVTEPAHRDDYKLRDVGHILFKVDTATATNPAVSYKTEEEAKAAAEKLYEELKAKLVDGKITKDAFEAAGKTVTHDSNVFYEDVNKGDMVAEFEEWLYAATTEGEIGLVKTSYGWHIMYYGGESEQDAWRPTAHDGATAEEMETWFADKQAAHKVNVNNNIFKKIFG